MVKGRVYETECLKGRENLFRRELELAAKSEVGRGMEEK
jgi:hypothetical protein